MKFSRIKKLPIRTKNNLRWKIAKSSRRYSKVINVSLACERSFKMKPLIRMLLIKKGRNLENSIGTGPRVLDLLEFNVPNTLARRINIEKYRCQYYKAKDSIL